MVHIRTITILWLSCLSLLAQPFTQSELGWQWQYKRTHGGGVIIDPTNGCGITLEAETVAYLQCVTTNASNSFLPPDWPRNWGVTNCNYYACGGSNQFINIPQTIDAVVKTMKADGLWAKMDAMYLFPFCYSVFGRTNALIMNSINLVSPSTTDFRIAWNTPVTDTNFVGNGFQSSPNPTYPGVNTFNGSIASWPRAGASYEYGFGTFIVSTPLDQGYTDLANGIIDEIGISNGSDIFETTTGEGYDFNGFHIQVDNAVYADVDRSVGESWKGFHHVSSFYNSSLNTISWTFWHNGNTYSTNGAAGGLSPSYATIIAPSYYVTDSSTYTNAVPGTLGAAFLTQKLTEAEQLQLNGDMINIMHGFRRD